MFDYTLLLAFIVAAAILTITPGLDTAMVLRASLTSRKQVALSAAAGIILGCLAWGLAVSLGLGILLQTSEILYSIVKLAGAAYLIWLGLGLVLRPRNSLSTLTDTVSLQASTALRQGLVTNLLNPKIGIFYVSFIPQFIPPEANVAAYSFFLAFIHGLLTLCWFTALIAAAQKLNRWMTSPNVIARMDRLTGVVFIGFGLKLALSRN